MTTNKLRGLFLKKSMFHSGLVLFSFFFLLKTPPEEMVRRWSGNGQDEVLEKNISDKSRLIRWINCVYLGFICESCVVFNKIEWTPRNGVHSLRLIID